MHDPMLRDVARYYKENLKGVESMCEAFEQTRYEKAIRIALDFIELGQLSLENIAKCCELPLEKVQELAKQKGASTAETNYSGLQQIRYEAQKRKSSC